MVWRHGGELLESLEIAKHQVRGKLIEWTSPNVNPFYLKFIAGSIRVCQGCKGGLRMKDNSIPLPPFDVVIGRAERRQFRDSKGNLITPRSEQAAHYHLNLQCIKAVEPGFVPQSLTIPPMFYHNLLPCTRNFCD